MSRSRGVRDLHSPVHEKVFETSLTVLRNEYREDIERKLTAEFGLSFDALVRKTPSVSRGTVCEQYSESRVLVTYGARLVETRWWQCRLGEVSLLSTIVVVLVTNINDYFCSMTSRFCIYDYPDLLRQFLFCVDNGISC